jgi:hypothetical protein
VFTVDCEVVPTSVKRIREHLDNPAALGVDDCELAIERIAYNRGSVVSFAASDTSVAPVDLR